MQPIKVKYFQKIENTRVGNTDLPDLFRVSGTESQVEQFFKDHETSSDRFKEVKEKNANTGGWLHLSSHDGSILHYSEPFKEKLSECFWKEQIDIEAHEKEGDIQTEFEVNGIDYDLYFKATIIKEGWKDGPDYENAVYKYTFEKVTYYNDSNNETKVYFTPAQLQEIRKIFIDK